MVNTLKNQIMIGVYAIYLLRKLKNPYVFPIVIIGFSFILLSFLVSIPNIVSNMITTRGSYHFFADAFSKADIVVQILLCLVSVSFVLYVKKLSLYTIDLIKERLA